MLSYRLHIYELAMTVTAEATGLALLLAPYKNWRAYSDDEKKAMLERDMPDLQRQSDELELAIEQFKAALPREFDVNLHAHGLLRHLGWVKFRIDRREPYACTTDPIDIAKRDVIQVLGNFENWYTQKSAEDSDLADRLKPLITQGHLNAALREAWAIFKTRMVTCFDIADNLDGHALADELFGTSGSTSGLLSNEECRGYLNLFKGLYTLYRNPVTHNDLPSDPEVIHATIALVNSAIVKIELALSD